MPERGFTLLEIMLVIFLIGLASSGVVQTFATDSEPPAKKAAQDFLTRFAQFKDRAVIEGQTLGVLIDAPGYQFMQRRQGQWLPVSATRLSAQVTVPKQVQMLLQPGSDIWQKEYRIHDGYLERLAWPLTDAAGSVKPTMQKLIPADSLRLQFYDGTRWQESWSSVQAIPVAVRMTLHSPQWGEIERIWLLRGPQ